MSTRIINENSDQIASRGRNNDERIEDKLLRDGERIKQKKHKQQEEHYRMSTMSNITNTTDYRKILYPKKKWHKEEEELDLEKISKIECRQQVINKLFEYYRAKPSGKY